MFVWNEKMKITMTKNRTIFCLALFAMLSVTLAQAQKKEKTYQKRENNHVLEKYDKCIDEAIRYQEDKEYGKDVEPYLYEDKGFLGVYFAGQEKYSMKKYPDYKDPLRKSLNHFGKFRKRDKDGEAFAEQQLFVTELKNETFNMMTQLQEKNDKSKMGSYAREIAKAFPDDGVMMMLSAAYLVASGNAGDGIKNADAAYKMLDSLSTSGEFKLTEQETKALSNSFVMYTDYLTELKEKPKENKEKAMKFIAL